ncbi:MAG: hypothetical protein HKP61_11500 [Dactylosporangium sp.]|nr:hypothetical protein [Dactylosporangium sp.]NNJ61551.1 hypothetical protein [Dactylosporangium sp.]
MGAHRVGVAVTAGLIGVLGLTGCEREMPAASASPEAAEVAGTAATGDVVEVPASLSLDGQALATIGFEPLELAVEDAEASPDPSTKAGTKGGTNRRRAVRRLAMHRNVLHGEFAITTPQGDKTVAVQRGVVEAVDADAITVKSTDGFVRTWAISDDLKVIKNRVKAAPGDITTGARVGISGVRDGQDYRVRLVVIPVK